MKKKRKKVDGEASFGFEPPKGCKTKPKSKKKKVKAKQHWLAPKKAVSPFLLFSKDNWADLAEKNPDKHFGEIVSSHIGLLYHIYWL